MNKKQELFQRYPELQACEADIDRAVLRVLTAKFTIGLMDQPFVDPAAADALADELAFARRGIRVLKLDGKFCFPHETGGKNRIFDCDLGEQDLDGTIDIQFHMTGKINFPHTAMTESFFNTITSTYKQEKNV